MTRRLYRSRKNRVIAGVSGGLGEYLDVDPVLFRIAFIVAAFAGGAGVLAYIIAWIIMPEQPREEAMSTPTQPSAPPQPQTEQKKEPPPSRGSIVGGLILIVLGLLFLGENFLPHFYFRDYWPLILVVIGIGLIIRSARPKTH
jgi:phage shock protein PspC (stress-responsive transcriptional regulator)